MQQLGHNQMGHPIMDRTIDENDTLLQEAREDVIGPLPPAGLLNDHGNEIVIGFDGIKHIRRLLLVAGTIPDGSLLES